MTMPAVGASAATYERTTIAPPSQLPGSRITSLDFVRGVVMILMAIDHSAKQIQ